MENYEIEILLRDDETCQDCGTRSNLQVHHCEFRSHGGTNDPENLILLCFRCHANHAHGDKADQYRKLYKRIAYERTKQTGGDGDIRQTL